MHDEIDKLLAVVGVLRADSKMQGLAECFNDAKPEVTADLICPSWRGLVDAPEPLKTGLCRNA